MKTLRTGRLAAAFLVALFVGYDDGHAQTRTPRALQAPPAIRIPAPARPAPTVRPGTAPAETRQRTPTPFEDLDGDGSVSALVGGDDCDDANPQRYPGATEIPNNEDEDCDPQSIGRRDLDGDGFIDVNDSNPGGAFGTDCNDSRPDIHPHAQELPNRIDDDCDGLVDNLIGSWWTPR
jgi:hypothetical protein